MPDLTKREREILTLIARSIEANGYQPTYRDIARHLGWASLGYLHHLSRSLTRKGVVTVNGARAWSFDWKSYLKETKHDARRTDGTVAARSTRRNVRRGRGGAGDRIHRTRAGAGR